MIFYSYTEVSQTLIVSCLQMALRGFGLISIRPAVFMDRTKLMNSSPLIKIKDWWMALAYQRHNSI